MLTVAAVAASLLIVAPLFGAAAETARVETYPVVVGQAGVTDGDTIRMAKATVTADGKTVEMTGVRIRFHGIDAPEKTQTCKDAKGKDWFCGRDASKAMAELVRGKVVTCRVHDIDRFKRLVSVCSVPGVPDINAELVKRGLAVAYREYSMDYVDEEDAARLARAGMWAGTFDWPWDVRKAKRNKN
jgi:endonuclease YncB( thermonuclease family)